MIEKSDKVYLTHAQMQSLAATLDVFAAALREHRELRTGDFQDVINEIVHFQQSPCVCGKPSGVATGGSVFCPSHALEFGD
jgi:hypothetical protein